MNPKTESASPGTAAKPRLSLLIATCFGLGYLPLAPGTWGSLAGLAVYWAVRNFGPGWMIFDLSLRAALALSYFLMLGVPALAVAAAGVWSSGRVARYVGKKDPQFVVIDEVSGQLFTYAFALAPLNWKYLLLGFILFRVFDIWKPFPVRQVESLPGGWGIMADDWGAAVYAALGLWIAQAAGL